MSKDCGPSLELGKLTEGIDGAKGELDSLIGTGTEGIAGNIAGLKDKISGLTDGIAVDLDSMIPEIPEPDFKLQDSLNKMLSGTPGEMMTNYAEMQEKLGDKVDLDKILDDFGLDSAELNKGLDDYKDKISKGDKLKEKFGGALDKIESALDSDLVKAATGDIEAIAALTGGFANKIFKGSDPTSLLDKICKQCPNIELDKEGNVVEKGPEAKVPQEDAVAEDPPQPKAEVKIQVKDVSKENADLLVLADPVEDVTPFEMRAPIDNKENVEFQKDLEKYNGHCRRLNSEFQSFAKLKRYVYDYFLINIHKTKEAPSTPDGDILASYGIVTFQDKLEAQNVVKQLEEKGGTEPRDWIIQTSIDNKEWWAAYGEFIKLFKINMDIKYGPLMDEPSSEFMIGRQKYSQINFPETKKGIKYTYPYSLYQFYFLDRVHNTTNRQDKLIRNIEKMEFIEIGSII